MIICVDLDSTLLKTDKSLSEYTIATFNKLYLKNHIIVINTARNYERTKKYAEKIKAKYVICNGGSQIFDEEGKAIYLNSICEEVVKKVIKEFKKCSEIVGVQTENDYYSIDADSNIELILENIKEAYKITIFKGDKNKINEICLNNNLEYIVYESGNWGKVSLKGVTKYSGLRMLLEIIGYKKEDVWFFGDDIGDLECLLNCGKGIAMKNSVREVLDKSNNLIICDTNDNDGVAKYINETLLCEEM